MDFIVLCITKKICKFAATYLQILLSATFGALWSVIALIVPENIKGAFLVAPADADCVEVIKDFAPMPTEKLPVPTCVVGSENDPYMTLERAKFFARAWNAKWFNAGSLGHINSDSNLGEWEQGRRFLSEFEKSL